MSKATSYEIQVKEENRWVTAKVMADATGAVQFADNLLARSNLEGVRVVRDFARTDGTFSENVIHEKTGEKSKSDITVTPVNEAPFCTRLEEGYLLPARMAMSRLFRKYFDEKLITPSELLHNGREMKRLGDEGRLLMTAVDAVAALQAPAGGAEAKERRDFLFDSWDKLMARAVQAAPAKSVAKATLPELAAEAGGGGERRFRLTVLLCCQLLDLRGWLGKLEKVMEWTGALPLPEDLEVMDGFIADLLMPAEAIQDLLGYQANLGSALAHMLDLGDGRAEPAKFAPPLFPALNKLFADGQLPQSRQALLTRVSRELRGANPLSRNEPAQEFETFLQMAKRIIGHGGVVGGPPMVEGLLHRYLRFKNVGGPLGFARAVEEIRELLGDGCRRVNFLLALAGLPPSATGNGSTASEILAAMAEACVHIDAWVARSQPPRERMLALTACNKAIRNAQTIDPALREQLAERTDATLARYLADEEVIEKIDKSDDPLALRALRLVKFCGSGVLIPGRSMDMAKHRVLDHLRQPQFEERFLASLPDQQQAERHLREFHRLLVESGFAG